MKLKLVPTLKHHMLQRNIAEMACPLMKAGWA
jgi:hypothetical protein